MDMIRLEKYSRKKFCVFIRNVRSLRKNVNLSVENLSKDNF